MSPDQIKDLANSIISAAAPQPPVEGLSAGERRAQLRALLHGINAKIGIRDPNWWDVAVEIVNEEIAALASPSLTAEPVGYISPDTLVGLCDPHGAGPIVAAAGYDTTIPVYLAAPVTLMEQSGAALDLQGPGKMDSEDRSTHEA